MLTSVMQQFTIWKALCWLCREPLSDRIKNRHVPAHQRGKKRNPNKNKNMSVRFTWLDIGITLVSNAAGGIAVVTISSLLKTSLEVATLSWPAGRLLLRLLSFMSTTTVSALCS
ncbi:hypothetical protein BD408DRAFT_409225, partial [Parasitella parasitica]